MQRRAFTLIELLVVITIIATLMGLLLAGLSVLQRMRAKATTERLLTNVVYAMTQYIDANPAFDATAVADLNGTPSKAWKYLGRNGNRYLELRSGELGDANGKRGANPQTADTIIDGFGLPLVVRITQGGLLNQRRLLARVEIASRAGSGAGAYPDADDLIWRFDADGSTGLSTAEARNVGKFWRKQ